MSDDLEIRIIDTITDYLNEHAGLNRHQTVKYRRPVAVLPESCPVLCVWLIQKASQPLTTDNDDSLITIGVSWQVARVERAETLQNDARKDRELLKQTLALERLLRDIFQRGWVGATGVDIPEAYDGFFAGADYTPPSSMETGVVEGYALTVRVMCQERR